MHLKRLGLPSIIIDQARGLLPERPRLECDSDLEQTSPCWRDADADASPVRVSTRLRGLTTRNRINSKRK